MSCDPVTPNQKKIVSVNWTNKTQLFLLYFSAYSVLYEYSYAEIMIFLSIALMSCGPLTSEKDSVSLRKYIITKKIMVKKVL